MAMLESILDGLRGITDDSNLAADSGSTPNYLNWGFTIYRTEYGGSSDQSWLVLLAKIQTQVADELQIHQDDKDDYEQTQIRERLQTLFHLDARSDTSLLQDRSIDNLRELFLVSMRNDQTAEGAATPPLNTTVPNQLHQRGYFLLADAEVLQDADRATNPELWVKCVQADYVAANYTPKNTRMGGQRYFGWIKMTTRSILELWNELNVRDLASLAPNTVGGMHVTTWNGELW